jgi:GTPase SAR1 family protein
MLGNDITLVIAGNKVDLEKKRVIGETDVTFGEVSELLVQRQS